MFYEGNRKMFRKKRKQFLLIILYIVGLMIHFPVMANAEETQNGGFSYEVIRAENQVNKERNYFDLRMIPKQKQTVQIKLINSTDKEMTVEVALNGAKTNSNGVIEYGPNSIDNDTSLKHDFTSVVSAPKEVVLAAKSEQMLNLEIRMPDTPFEGYISGGIQLQEKGQEGQKSGMLVNKFAYLIGMLLSESDPASIQPDLKLNKIYPDLNNYRNAIIVDFSNVQPVYVDDMITEVKIKKNKTNGVVYSSKNPNMRMAPNTAISYPISLNGEKMIPGDYEAEVTVSASNDQKWSWKESFTITREEADKLNKQDLVISQDSELNWVLIALIFVATLLLLLIVLVSVLVIRRAKVTDEKHFKKRKKVTKKDKRS